MMQNSILSTIAGIAALSSTVATAQTAPVGSQIHFATCTLPGVETGCLIARSGSGIYNVTGLKPGLRAHQWLQGTAKVTGKSSFCMQGPVVDEFVPDKQQSLVGCVDLKAVKPRR